MQKSSRLCRVRHVGIVRAEQNRACAISLILTLAQVRSFSGATSMTFRLLASLTKPPGPVSSKNLEVLKLGLL